MGFSKRRINRQTLNIMRKVGRVIACYKQIDNFANEAQDRVPSDLFSDNQPIADVDYQVYYIFGIFEQDAVEQFTQAGKIENVTASITIHWMYKTILAQTAYFDPFLNGSKFIKVGAAIDDESITITQALKALYLPQSPEVS